MQSAVQPKLRLAVIQAWFTPYRAPLFQAIHQNDRFDLTVIYGAPVEAGRQWAPPPQLPYPAIFLQPRAMFSYRRRRLFGEKGVILYPQGLMPALSRIRPEIVVGYEFRPECMVACLYAALRGCSYVTWSDVTAAHDARMGRLRWLIRRLMLSRSDALIGSSSATLAHFQQNFRFPAQRSSLSILSAHVDDFRQAAAATATDNILPRSSCRLIYVGRLSELKGVDLLINAFSRLLSRLPDLNLTIIGSGPQKKTLVHQANRSGAGHRIVFKNPVPHAELAAELCRHDVFVFPSRLDVFGLVVAEAIACGLPVICSCHAGAAVDLVDGNGIIVDPERVSDLAAAIERLATDPGQRRLMAARGGDIIAKHNLSSAVSGFMDAIEMAAVKSRRPPPAGNRSVAGSAL